jgi:DHA3 family tetracycline resistance protein-like MFS transporter
VRRPSAYRYYLFVEAATSLPAFVVIALYWVKTVELDPLQLVLVGTVMEAAIFVFEVPTGVFADLFGRKRSIVLSWAIQGGAILLVGAVPELWAALAGWAIWGFGYTFSSGAYEAWITDEVGADNVGPVFARGMQYAYAGALVGLPLSIGLASATSLRTGVLTNGALLLAVAAVSAALMPETGFRRERRPGVALPLEAFQVARRGARLIRGRPVLLLLVVAAFFAGAYTEGFDRLSEAHFIRNVGLPSFGGLSDLWWFALLGAAGMVLGFLASGYLVRRLRVVSRRRMAAMLLGLSAFQAVAVAAFGLAAGFTAAVAAWLAVRLGRSLAGPLYMTWLNQSIDDSSVRATVISMSGQSDAIGQVAGGPGVGAVGRWFSIRAALVTAGFILLPTIVLYARALKHHGAEPELEQLPAAEPARL